jgi:hypothetical protein
MFKLVLVGLRPQPKGGGNENEPPGTPQGLASEGP